MARRTIGVLLLFVVTIFSSACSNTATDIVAKQDKIKLTEDEKIPYIGFVLDTLSDERWYKDKALFEEQVKSLGGKVKTLAANGLNDVQYKQAQLLIDEGVDVLVVVPQNAEEASKIVKLAHEHNVKVISYDRLITKADVDYYISFDNEKVGELQAQEIVKHVSKGNFAYIGGAETDNNAILFRKGAMSVLQPLIDKGDIKLVYDKYTVDWNPDIAQSNMQEALNSSSNNINAVVAANDGTAGGVISTLTSAGLAGKVAVSGQDAELNGVKRIVAGTQTMTVYKSINLIAQQAAEMAVKVAKGEEIETSTTVDNNQINVPSILLEPIPVTKENIESTIIKDGYLTKEEIYNN